MPQERAWLVALALLAVLVVCPSALALDRNIEITQYVESVYRAPQFLPHDDVSAILQTRDGYLWVGTVEGLARFDGVRSVVYNKSTTPAFENNWIWALLEDDAGRLWIATYGGGLVCRENGRFKRYGEAEGMPADIILSLMEDREHRVWVGTHSKGLFRFDHGRFAPVDLLGGAAESVKALLEDRRGTMWIGTESGLFRRDVNGTTRLTRSDGLSDDAINCLAEDRDGIWVGTVNAGVNHIVGDRITSITTENGLTHDRVWSLTVDRDQNVWVGTDGGGLDRWSGGRLTSMSTRNGLANDYVWAIREDREGTLWVGTNGGGLTSLRNGSVVSLTTREGLPSDFVWTVIRTHDGGLWIGTEDSGLVSIRDGKMTTYGDRYGLMVNAKVLMERRDGTLVLGGNDGACEWKGEGFEAVTLPIHDRVAAFLEDPDGGLWIATGTSGLRYWRDGRMRTLTKEDGLSSNALTSLFRARDGALWIGTLVGIDRMKDGEFTSWTNADGLTTDYVTSIFQTEDGSIWGTSRTGIFRIRDGQVRTITSRQGLYDDGIVVSLRGEDGGFWMGGNRGLHRTPFEDLVAVMDGRRAKVRSLGFGLEDGLRSVELNSSSSSAWKDPDGRLFFATRVGVATVDPSHLVRNPVPPPVVIEAVFADGKELSGPELLEIPSGTRRLDLRFAALSFVAPDRVRLRHRLEGFDPDWVDSEQRETSYTNLRPGKYVFRVVAANRNGVWNEEGAGVRLVVRPLFWETLWFRGLVLFFFLLVGPLFYLLRVGVLQRRQAELERIVAERTAEVQAANARLAQLAREDGLTGVANRRRLDEALDEEWRRAQRARAPLAFFLIDVDFFKQYNDVLGHQAGDDCLKTIAGAVAEAHARAGELVARFGGEEFALLMPSIPKEQTGGVAEELRRKIQELRLPHPGSAAAEVVTVSVGAAWVVPTASASVADLIAAADAALYRAKRAGRNRVEMAASVPDRVS